MINFIINIIRFILKKLNLAVMLDSQFIRYKSLRKYEILEFVKEKNIKKIYTYWPDSKSQLKQDLFVIDRLEFKEKGFFCELGAADGISFSNTWILEKKLNWDGLLIEASKQWKPHLIKNRNSKISYDCVWSKTGESINFNEVGDVSKKISDKSDEFAKAMYSTIDQFSNKDIHSRLRKKGKKYKLEGITLTDLFQKFNVPKEIDYLSIDTEGSEFEILSVFDFDKYKIKIITVEHNYSKNREKIFKLLTNKSYERVLSNISEFDDWYVLR
tara:strand:- start:824 stop:1636 length:813 start_codon:yes stop_codon:yes gene_type:complete